MPTILVVDDDTNLCAMYETDFGFHGHTVLVAHNGQDALRAVADHHVDVVVMDIAMPGMDGIEALGKILAVDNRLPVILNSGYSSYKEDFMTWAAEEYVTKSGDTKELLAAINRALEKHGGRRDAPAEPQEQS